MLSEPFQVTQRIQDLDMFQKIYGVLLLIEILYRGVEITFGHNFPEIYGDCYEIWTNESLCCVFKFMIFIAYFFVDKRKYNSHPWIIRLIMSAPQCVQVGTGIWAIIIQYTISDQCRTFWVTEGPIIWLGINLNLWILWFVLGMDYLYLLNAMILTFRKSYGIILLIEIIYISIDFMYQFIEFLQGSDPSKGDCYNVWRIGSMCCFCKLLVFMIYIFVNSKRFNTDPRIHLIRRHVITISQYLMVGTGIWALVTQYTISDQCRAHWVSEWPVVWLGIELNLWIMWFVLGMDVLYLLNVEW
jgi:hypothetical protein